MAANNKRKFNKEYLRWRAINFINSDLLPRTLPESTSSVLREANSTVLGELSATLPLPDLGRVPRHLLAIGGKRRSRRQICHRQIQGRQGDIPPLLRLCVQKNEE